MDNEAINAIVAKVLISAHAGGHHKDSTMEFCPLCQGNTFKVKCIKSIRYNRYLIKGEIYTVIRARFVPANHMIKASTMYTMNVPNDTRIHQYESSYFEVLSS